MLVLSSKYMDTIFSSKFSINGYFSTVNIIQNYITIPFIDKIGSVYNSHISN